MTGSDLRTEKTRAIFPTARILFRMTSFRMAVAPPETSPQYKGGTQYSKLIVHHCGLHNLILIFLALKINN